MRNRELQATYAYHDATKHSYQSIRTNPHYLDWENQPIPFKIYPKLEPIPLPQHLSSSGMAALDAIAIRETRTDLQAVRSIQTLAEIFYLSAGITKRRRHHGGEMLFRAAACTGALYHIDLYCISGDLSDLAAGVYHFGPHDFALRKLRDGDYRAVIARASGDEPALAEAPVILAAVSTYWRNAWKYQSRAYRHCYWDSGTLLANLLAAAAARQVPARVVIGFEDAVLSRILALDTGREGALSLVALGTGAGTDARHVQGVEPLTFETMPLSKKEIDYPAIRAMHEASSLESEREVTDWRNQVATPAATITTSPDAPATERLVALRPLADDAIPPDTIEEVIQRRGSTREFARASISFSQLSTMLDRATRGIPADFLAPEVAPLNDLYLIVHAVDDLPPGAYVYLRKEHALQALKQGDFRSDAGHLGLGQRIPADCSVNVYLLADLKRVMERLGNRGYRAAQLEAAVIGGKLYLAAYAQRLGASGLTFFDDDVTEFFSPHAAGQSVMFLIALGRAAKRKPSTVL